MSLRGSRYRSLPVVVTLMAAAASTLSAQGPGRRLFEWRGDVDREVQVVMRGREVWTRDIGNNEPRRHREQVASPLPREEGEVWVRLEDGRGDADVIQQPTARNNYTTIVRIRDGRSGADRYRLDAYWQASSRGGWERGHGSASQRDGVLDRNGDRDRSRNGDYNDDRDRGGYGRDGSIDTRDRTGGRGPWDGGVAGTRSVMHWSGDVDDVLEIRVQGQHVEYRTLSGAAPRRIQADVNGIPQREADLRVTQRQGRGDVSVVQQPSSRNGYTAIIRVNDPQGGYGSYSFDLAW